MGSGPGQRLKGGVISCDGQWGGSAVVLPKPCSIGTAAERCLNPSTAPTCTPPMQRLPRGVVLQLRLLARRLAGRAPLRVQGAGRGAGGGEGAAAAGSG